MHLYTKGARGSVKEGNQISKVQFFEQKSARLVLILSEKKKRG